MNFCQNTPLPSQESVDILLQYLDSQFDSVDMNRMFAQAMISLLRVQRHFEKKEKKHLDAWKDDEKPGVKRRVRVTTVNGDVVTGEQILQEPLIVRSDDTGETVAFKSVILKLESFVS